MNATEQREHRTVTKALDSRLDSIEPIVLQLMNNDNAIVERFAKLDDVLQKDFDRLNKLTDVLYMHDRNVQARLASLEALKLRAAALTFWQRLRWLLTGNSYSV